MSFDSLYDFTQENFTGIRVIKAFVKENQEIIAFAKIAKKNHNTNIKFVFGVEAYWVKNRHEEDKSNCHIIILARNDNGRKAFCKRRCNFSARWR